MWKKNFVENFVIFRISVARKKKAKEQRSFFAQLIVATTILMVFAEFFCLAEFVFAKFHKNNFREIWHRFCIVSLNSFSRKNVKFYEKVCEIRTKSFLFCENVRLLETLSSVISYNLGFDLKKNVIWKTLNLAGKWVW